MGGLLVETKSRVVVKRRRFTAEEYHKMAEAGILHEDDRVELIEGEIVDMAPIGSRHATCVRELVWLLSKQLSDELRLDVQNPVRLVEYGEPQTDLAVIRAGDYAGALPEPGDVLLLIEVSDTTLRYDPEVKLPLYARSGVPEVWVDGPHGWDDGAPHWSLRRWLPAHGTGAAGRDARFGSVAYTALTDRRCSRLIRVSAEPLRNQTPNSRFSNINVRENS
jgi:Uma2 family endonuclease